MIALMECLLLLFAVHEAYVLVMALLAMGKTNPEEWLIASSQTKKTWWRAFNNRERLFWLYAIIIKAPSRDAFKGSYHAGVGLQGGNASSWKGWAIINMIPVPVVHLLIYHKSHVAADVMTFACIMSTVWLWAEYRASCIRPVSIDANFIYIRYGVFVDRVVDMAAVQQVQLVSYRDSLDGVSKYAGLGSPNVLITLKDDAGIAIGVDDPGLFVIELGKFLNTSVPHGQKQSCGL